MLVARRAQTAVGAAKRIKRAQFEWHKMRILVTGAAGFIGSQVVRHIVREGHSVCALVRPGSSVDLLADVLDRLSVMSVDLNNGRVVQEVISTAQPECAVHLAWYAVPGKYWTAPENLDCVSMTLSLAKALAAVGCTRPARMQRGKLCKHTANAWEFHSRGLASSLFMDRENPRRGWSRTSSRRC